ncbi:MAG: ATP-binding cassette domain-containing protein [Actinobacteria bacterium]|nr:ATP-binding cassette domain-containing protein [Actinomycetota bacterium]
MTEPILQVGDLSFGYTRATRILAGVSFAVDAGESCAIVGVNGAGKTTLLRVLAGLEPAARGEILLDGISIVGLTAQERVARGLVTVFGGRDAVFGDLTVDDNLLAGAFGLWREGEVAQDRIDAAYELFPELAARRGSLGVQLSGGEQQMLALAKAFILRPRLLCIDELSLGLAPVLVERLMRTLKDIAATGVSVILVEQSSDIARMATTRTLHLERGVIRGSRAAPLWYAEGEEQHLSLDDLRRALHVATVHADVPRWAS